MRLVTAEKNGETFAGVWIEGDAKIVKLAEAARAAGRADADQLATMQGFIEAGSEAHDWARELSKAPPDTAVVATADCRLLAPLPKPEQIRDFLCFEEHLKNSFEAALKVRTMGAEDPEAAAKELRATGFFDIPKVWYERPVYYTCSRFAVAGPEDEVVWPTYSNLMDYELEFAAVIGKAGKNLSKENALDHIFGFTIFNDFSARDEQTIVMEGKLGPGKGKDFDRANVFGPCIVTMDEIGDPYNLDMTARVNGEEWSRGNSGAMYYKFEDLLANITRGETINPGEIICSGTVGTGCGLEHLKFLSDGDTIELEIEKIGVLRNKVVRND